MSALRAADLGSILASAMDLCSGRYTSDLKIVSPVVTCQLPGIVGSLLGLVGPVSVYCDMENFTCNFCLSVAAHTNL